jgi:Peptidase family M23
MKRVVILLPVLLALQVGVQPALAWTWPVDGPVLKEFSLGDDPYAAGHHRGVDVAAPAGASVRAPAAGTVSFAGTVPGGGRAVTIRTPDGYAVTLLHLGALGVARSATVGEGDAVGSVGPSGVAEHAEPYVHLGVRLAADPNGYVNPLALLPPRAAAAPEPAPEPTAEPEPVPAGARQAKPRTAPAAREVPKASRPATTRAGGEVAAGARARSREEARRPARAANTRSVINALPRRTALRSFEQPGATVVALQPRPQRARTERERPWAPVALAVGAAAAAAAAALGLRRKLRDAGAANRTTPVLLQLASASAEHAGGLRPGEHDRLVVNRDLEGILLGEPETFPDLDGDDDAPEFVEVADDARGHAVPSLGCRSPRLSRPHGPRAGLPPRTLTLQVPDACAF